VRKSDEYRKLILVVDLVQIDQHNAKAVLSEARLSASRVVQAPQRCGSRPASVPRGAQTSPLRLTQPQALLRNRPTRREGVRALSEREGDRTGHRFAAVR